MKSADHSTTPVAIPVKRETYPNFDFLRLVAATSVVFSHAFLIGEGSEAREPFVQFLGPHNILGIYGVHCFFLMSGFLVTQSLAESKSLLRFLRRRCLRIYPALLVCLCLCAFVLGPFFSEEGALNFLRTPASVEYVLGNLLRPGRLPSMAGVSFYSEPSGWLGTMVNGSLWTIFYEVACYVLIALLAVVGALRAWSMGLFAVLLVVAGIVELGSHSETISDFLFVAPGFFAGAALCLTGIQRMRSPAVVLFVTAGSVLAMVFAWRWQLLAVIFPVAGAVPILRFATSLSMRLPSLHRLGDISYGTYLYGWPVEQAIRSIVGAQAGWLAVFAIALPAVYVLGLASWWIVERPALRYKR